MLAIFRTNQAPTGFLFLLYILLLRWPQYLFGPMPSLPLGGGLFSSWLNDWLGASFWWQEGIMVTLLFVQAFLISLLVMEQRLAREVSLYPGVFYILVTSSSIYFQALNGLVLANTFLLLALWELMRTYRRPSCADRLFNVGFWIGIAGFFYFSANLFILWALPALNLLRAFKLREWLTVVVGWLTPVLLLATWLFWNDSLGLLLQEHVGQNAGFPVFRTIGSLEEIFTLSVFFVLLVVVLLSYRSYVVKQNIQVQRKVSTLFLALFVGLLSLLVQSQVDVRHLLILAIPISILLSFNFIDMSGRLAGWLHFIWFLTLILFQVHTVFF